MTDDNTTEPSPYKRARVARRASQAHHADYEGMGAKRFARQPPRILPPPAYRNEDWTALRGHLEQRLNMLRSWRYSWVENWWLLEGYILPRRGIFINAAMPTPNTMIRGVQVNQNIVDPTGTYAMRRCAAGMFNGLMSPSRPWFKLKPAFFARDIADPDSQEWFEEVESRMYTVMARSNFYTEGAGQYEDIVTFGTGPQIIYEDDQDIIRCYTPCPGEYFIAAGADLRAQSLYRLWNMTVAQIVDMFGVANCPPSVQKQWQSKGGSLEVEWLVAHAIEPNFPIDAPGMGRIDALPGDFTYREIYWLYGGDGDYPMSLTGFNDPPFVAPRWAITSNDPYGRSVGMDVFFDILQLQVETKRKAEAIEKLVRPPMLASMDLKNEPNSILPGRVTYVNQLDAGKGMRPIYTVNPEIAEMQQDIQAIQVRIKEGFFNDLFAMLEQTGDHRMTATEVSQRNQEKLQLLGPVIERLQNEDLGPKVKRVFRVLERKGLLPPLPQSLHGVPLGIEYVGMLSLAQKAAKTATMERFANTAMALEQRDPSVADCWDKGEWLKEYGDDLSLSKRIMNSPQKIQQLRQTRAQAQQQANAQATISHAADTAKTLSDVDVGGGLNAIQLMTGMAQPAAAG
ncbi:MAG TPA: portal protein [Stellaceae bacterium]|nr:portal protein [Stellaceae bacterium]